MSCFILGSLQVACVRSEGSGRLASQVGPGPQTTDPGTRSNIIRVNKFFSAEPWLSFTDDGTRKINGVKFSLYLESGDTGKGVFGDGTIVVTMYRLTHDPLGREAASQVYEWVLPSDKALPWRARKETYLGWGYGIRLPWGAALDVAGRQVAFVIKYIRRDGRVITSSRQVLRVPKDSESGSTVAS